MKRIYICIVLSLTLTAISCQKENASVQYSGNDPEFTATIVQDGTKTVVDGKKISWELYDVITITDNASTSVKYGVIAIDSDGTAHIVKLYNETGTLGEGPYTATFGTTPSSVQTYGDPVEDIPMTAYSETTDLQFTATGSILDIYTTSIDKTIKQIQVRNSNSTDNTFILKFKEGVSLSTPQKFRLAVSPGTYTTFRFIMDDGTGAEKVGKNIVVEANHIVSVSPTFFTSSFLPTYEDGSYIGVAVEVAGYYWAPVNCGYSSDDPKGLFYQWAKKQGFATSGDVYKTKDICENMSEGVGRTDFIYQKFNHYCWYDNCKVSDVWPTSKDYDPCPQGWRLPSFDEMSALADASNKWVSNEKIEGAGSFVGRRFPSTGDSYIFLPAAGGRRFDDAEIFQANSIGYCWTWSPHPTDNQKAWLLEFDSDEIEVTYSSRSHAYSVRCIHE